MPSPLLLTGEQMLVYGVTPPTNLQQLGQSTEDSEEMQESETEADVETESLELPEAKITTFKDAIIALEGVATELSRKPWAYVHFNDVHLACCRCFNCITNRFNETKQLARLLPTEFLIKMLLYIYHFLVCLFCF